MATRNVLITGGSSGIGAALARAYAREGTHLILWGRDEKRLEDVAAECRKSGAGAETRLVDLRDIDATKAELAQLDARAPIDLAILNAGLGGTEAAERRAESPQRVHDMALVNFTSPVVSATVLAEKMAERGRGQIVLMSSLAEGFPLPMAPTYSATKAGLSMFAEALELRMRRHGVSVTLVSPGFIDTPMSRDLPKKPFLMEVEKAAKLMKAKIDARRRRVVLPWSFVLVCRAARLVPRPMRNAVLRRQKG